MHSDGQDVIDDFFLAHVRPRESLKGQFQFLTNLI
jgi:hypothetical protein